MSCHAQDQAGHETKRHSFQCIMATYMRSMFTNVWTVRGASRLLRYRYYLYSRGHQRKSRRDHRSKQPPLHHRRSVKSVDMSILLAPWASSSRSLACFLISWTRHFLKYVTCTVSSQRQSQEAPLSRSPRGNVRNTWRTGSLTHSVAQSLSKLTPSCLQAFAAFL
jgi:hypothetical protein